MDRDKITNNTVNLGMCSNILLSVLKTFIGILGHSAALLADGINSSSDVIYYIAVKIFMHQAHKPADAEHPYGHRQLESISAIVVGAFIVTTGVAIFWEAINAVYDLFAGKSEGQTASFLALIVAVFTFGLKLYLYYKTKQGERITKNPTLRALANDHFNDILASFAVVIGIMFGRFGVTWMDPLAGAVVAIFILRTGVTIIMESSAELMDTFPDDRFKNDVKNIALKVEGVRMVDDIGVHRFGSFFIVNISIGVDADIPIRAGHDIADCVEHDLLHSFEGSIRKVIVHYHPAIKPHEKQG